MILPLSGQVKNPFPSFFPAVAFLPDDVATALRLDLAATTLDLLACGLLLTAGFLYIFRGVFIFYLEGVGGGLNQTAISHFQNSPWIIKGIVIVPIKYVYAILSPFPFPMVIPVASPLVMVQPLHNSLVVPRRLKLCFALKFHSDSTPFIPKLPSLAANCPGKSMVLVTSTSTASPACPGLMLPDCFSFVAPVLFLHE